MTASTEEFTFAWNKDPIDTTMVCRPNILQFCPS